MIRAVATVLNGNVIAQVISLAALPILSKVFTDQAFGAFQLYSSILVALLPFAALRLEYVILNLSGSERDLSRVLTLCLGINLAGAFIVLALLVGPIGWIWPGARTLPFPIWLLPLGFICVGTLQTFGTLPVRQSAFRLVAQARVLQSLAFNLGAIGVGLVVAGAPTLLLSDIASRLASSLLIFRKLRLTSLGRFDGADLRWMCEIVSQYRRYPLYAVPSGLLSGISMGLPVMALSALFPISEVGQFAMAWRVTLLPLGVLAFSVSQVVNARLAATRREGDGLVRPQILRVAMVMFGFGLVGGALALVLGQASVALVLGEKWRVAGTVIAVLAPMVISTLTVAPLNTALTLLGHQRAQVLWDLARLAGLLTVFGWSSQSGMDLLTTVRAYVWTAVSFSLIYFFILLMLCDRPGSASTEREPTRVP